MITKLVGIATLFAAGSMLPAAPAPAGTALGAREIAPATMAPLPGASPAATHDTCGTRRCASTPRCGRRCASRPSCGRRCASNPSCARRCAVYPRCSWAAPRG